MTTTCLTPSHLAAGSALLLAALLTGCGGSSSSSSSPVPVAQSCFWGGPYVREVPETNIAYPDTGATYWSARFELPPGASLELHGNFPQGRYMSLTSYDGDRPYSTLSDRDIEPLPGHINPFRTGHPRSESQRSYRVALTENANGASNTVELVRAESIVLYRVYVADPGLDRQGGQPLPAPVLTLADGRTLEGDAACAELSASREVLEIPMIPAPAYDAMRAANNPAMDPPLFRAAYSSAVNIDCSFLNKCAEHEQQPAQREVRFYAVLDNQYVYSYVDRAIKPLVVLRGKLPKTPQTRGASHFDDNGSELRYWSLCQNEYFSQQVNACLYDEQLLLGDNDEYLIVTGLEQDRPSNATDACKVSFLPWPEAGDGRGLFEGGTNNETDGFLILRNMLPAPGFTQAVQHTTTPGDEAQVMGEYLPDTAYFTVDEFEAFGCDVFDQLQRPLQ